MSLRALISAVCRKRVDLVRKNLSAASLFAGFYQETPLIVAIKRLGAIEDDQTAPPIEDGPGPITFEFEPLISEIFDILITEGRVSVDCLSGDRGDSALHYAVQTGSIPLIKFLLAHGASPLIRNHSDFTPLEMAIIYNRTDVVLFLMEVTDPPVDPEESALHSCIFHDMPHMLQPILDSPFNTQAHIDYTALAAVDRGNTCVLRHLVERGAKLPDSTVSITAIQNFDLDMLWFLLIECGFPQVADANGVSLFWIAARYRYFVENDQRYLMMMLIESLCPSPSNCVPCVVRNRPMSRMMREVVASLQCCLRSERREELTAAEWSLAANNWPNDIPFYQFIKFLFAISVYRGKQVSLDIPRQPFFDDIRRLISLPWKPSSHSSWNPLVSQHQKTTLLVAFRLETSDRGVLPYLPLEMWLTIMSFVQRSWFVFDGDLNPFAVPRILSFFHVSVSVP